MSLESKAHDNKVHEKLVRMANQIGKFFVSQGPEKAPPAIAEHIAKFWDPRMRSAILAHVKEGGEGLDPPVLAAIKTLPEPAVRD